MGILINKQADFVVRFARNLESKPLEERLYILNDVPPKTRQLLNKALAIFANKRSKTR